MIIQKRNNYPVIGLATKNIDKNFLQILMKIFLSGSKHKKPEYLWSD